jgi:hypothetical protein
VHLLPRKRARVTGVKAMPGQPGLPLVGCADDHVQALGACDRGPRRQGQGRGQGRTAAVPPPSSSAWLGVRPWCATPSRGSWRRRGKRQKCLGDYLRPKRAGARVEVNDELLGDGDIVNHMTFRLMGCAPHVELEHPWSVPNSYEMPVDRVAVPKPKDRMPLQLTRRAALPTRA